MKCIPKKIYIVFKTHFDVGFTDLAKNIIDGYSTNLMPTVVSACKEAREKNPDYPYVWTMSAWPLKKALESDKTEENVLKEMESLIKSGELAWHKLPFTTHTEFCGTEEYIRGMYIAKDLDEKYGTSVISAKMTDVPGHTRALVSLLSKAGVKFLHLGCNPASMPPDVPRLFWWEAPDKSRVLTFYNKGGYGSSILPPSDWEFPVWLALMQTNDNCGPHKPEQVAEYVSKAKEIYPDVEVVIGTMDDFYHELAQYNLNNVPVIDKDLADTWIHGAGAYPAEVGHLRSTRHLVDETQKLSALWKDANKENYERTEQKLKDCYENDLLFGEHTWGLDVKTTLGMDRHYEKEEFLKHMSDDINIRIEASWDEQRDRERESTAAAKELARKQIHRLAREVEVSEPHVTIFNGLGFKRNAWITLPDNTPDWDNMILWGLKKGRALPVIHVNGQKKVWVTGIPAFGYITFILKQAEEPAARAEKTTSYDEESGVLENMFFRLTINKELGTISSLVDKRTGKEWADQESDGLFQYRYDVHGTDDITDFLRTYPYRYYDWAVNDFGRLAYPEQPHVTCLPQKADVQVEKLENGIKAILTCRYDEESYKAYGNCAKSTVEVTLYDNDDVIDIHVSLPDKQKTPFVESGHLLFPFAAEKPQIRFNKMGQTVDIAKDIIKDGNHALYCCENWIDVTEGENSVTLICKDSPLNSVGDNNIYKYYPEYVETKPVIYNNLFNTMWGTNFPQWIEGSLEFDYRLVFGKNEIAEKNKAALSFTSPILTYYRHEAEGGNLAPYQSFLKTDGEIHILTAKEADRHNGLIIRIQDMTGEEHETTLDFDRVYREIWECTSLEDKTECLGKNMDLLKLNLKPYEIKTLLLKSRIRKE